jgi:flagellar hook assembly protein FlgD
LGQNFPNPVINSTKIEFSIAKAGHVSLKIMNITGKEVVTIIHEKMGAGMHSVELKTDNIPNGIYFYRLESESFSVSKKMVVNK